MLGSCRHVAVDCASEILSKIHKNLINIVRIISLDEKKPQIDDILLNEEYRNRGMWQMKMNIMDDGASSRQKCNKFEGKEKSYESASRNAENKVCR